MGRSAELAQSLAAECPEHHSKPGDPFLGTSTRSPEVTGCCMMARVPSRPMDWTVETRRPGMTS